MLRSGVCRGGACPPLQGMLFGLHGHIMDAAVRTLEQEAHHVALLDPGDDCTVFLHGIRTLPVDLDDDASGEGTGLLGGRSRFYLGNDQPPLAVLDIQAGSQLTGQLPDRNTKLFAFSAGCGRSRRMPSAR